MHPRVFRTSFLPASPAKLWNTTLQTALPWVVSVLLLPQAVNAQNPDTPTDKTTTKLWELGIPDQSSAEFKPWFHPMTQERQIDYLDASQDPVFVIGTSKPEVDWQAYQPGDANGQAGFRPHPFTILFPLSQVTPGTHRLEVRFLTYSARLPHLEVSVNQHTGIFHLRPQLNYEAGDNAVFFQPHYSTAVVEAAIPSDWLRGGGQTNRIVLIARDHPADRDDTRPYGFPWPGSSGLVYDSLTFLPPAVSSATDRAFHVECTPFYRSKDSQLWEELEWDVPIHPGDRTLEVEMRIKDWSWKSSRALTREFGEERFVIHAPDFSPAADARLTIRRNGVEEVRDRQVSLVAARKWRLLIMPNAHLDVGYTDFAAKVSEIQTRSIERILEMAERRPEFRFTLDGFWIVEEFLRGRQQEAHAPFLDAVKRGTIAIPACYGSAFTGFASLENLVRSIYPSARFAASHGLPLEFALNTDVPSYSWSYASVLASAGISNFVAASDAYRGPFLLYNRLNERSPHHWEGPDGSRVFTWLSRHYHQAGSLFSFPHQVVAGRQSLSRFLQAYEKAPSSSDIVLVYGTQVENVDLHPGQADLVSIWNAEYAFPKLEYAGFGEAMRRLRESMGGSKVETNAPVVRGDGGPYWEDGLAAHARATAGHRKNMQRILSAETLGTMAFQANPRFRADSRVSEHAWQRLLLTDEHSWHADCSTREPLSIQSMRQGAEKEARIHEAARDIDALLSRAMSALADSIQATPGNLVVFNSLSWERDGWVEWDVNRGTRIIDVATGEPVPTEPVAEGRQIQRVRFLASKIPAVGYRVYALRPGPVSKSPSLHAGAGGNDVSSTENAVENAWHRLEWDPNNGRLVRWHDKTLQRDWVSREDGQDLGSYLYVTGGDQLPNRLVQLSSVTPKPPLTSHPTIWDGPPQKTKSPLGWKLIWTGRTQGHPRVIRTLYLPEHASWMEFEHRLTKDLSWNKEAAYLVFPFHIDQPRFRWATQNGWVDPTRDLLPGGSMEWFCTHEWSSVSDERGQVSLVSVDAPLLAVGDIVRGSWPREFGKRKATLYPYLMSNYTPEGYQAGQGGEFTFRTVLRSDGNEDPVARYRLGREALTPLEVNEITRNDKLGPGRGSWPGDRGSFLQVHDSHLSLVTWKPAEQGKGTILRFLEVGGARGTARIEWSPATDKQVRVYACNALEVEKERLVNQGSTFELPYGPFQILTVKVVSE